MGSSRPPSDAVIEKVVSSIAPCTLPMQAYGPNAIEWFDDPTEVWVWISWPHKVAERLAGTVLGANDRVCIVEVKPDLWSRWQPVVWRNAVTRRDAQPSSSSR